MMTALGRSQSTTSTAGAVIQIHQGKQVSRYFRFVSSISNGTEIELFRRVLRNFMKINCINARHWTVAVMRLGEYRL